MPTESRAPYPCGTHACHRCVDTRQYPSSPQPDPGPDPHRPSRPRRVKNALIPPRSLRRVPSVFAKFLPKLLLAEAARCLDLPHLQASALLAVGNPPDFPATAAAAKPASVGGCCIAEKGRSDRRSRVYSDTCVAGTGASRAGKHRGVFHLRVCRREWVPLCRQWLAAVDPIVITAERTLGRRRGGPPGREEPQRECRQRVWVWRWCWRWRRRELEAHGAAKSRQELRRRV